MNKKGWLLLAALSLLFVGFLVSNRLTALPQTESLTVLDKPAKIETESGFSPESERILKERAVDASRIDKAELLRLTNDYRGSKGLSALAINQSLNHSALDKCIDIVSRDYWSHNAPDGSKYTVFISKYFGKRNKDGENLAKSYYSSREVIQAWKDSPTHNELLLDPEYQLVGTGVCKSDNFIGSGPSIIVVQHFLGY